MSNYEFAKTLIDQIPETRLYSVIAFLQGAAIPDETPNADTIAAMQEIDAMIDNGGGEHYSGSTRDFFKMLAEG